MGICENAHNLSYYFSLEYNGVSREAGAFPSKCKGGSSMVSSARPVPEEMDHGLKSSSAPECRENMKKKRNRSAQSGAERKGR